MAAQTDLYAILGVSRDAGAEEIKKAYRRLARKHHPDVNKGDKASEERFKEISAAFEVLGNPEKRKLYDEFGPAALRQGFNAEEARAWRRYGGGAPGGFPGGFPGGAYPGGAGAPSGAGGPFEGFDISDLFSDLFQRSGGRPTRSAGADIEAKIEVTLREAALGAERDLAVERPSSCETCGGGGTVRGRGAGRCARCGGSGRVTRSFGGVGAVQVACPQCHGTGVEEGPPCPACGGTGEVPSQVRLRVKIPAGVEEGSVIRLAGQGGPGVAGGPPGDLLLHVRLRPHPSLRRSGRDLEMDLPVTVREALEGAEIDVPTLGGAMRVRVPAGTQGGTRLRLRGQGMPGLKGARGDLYLVVQVRLPPADDPAALEAARALETHYRESPRADLSV